MTDNRDARTRNPLVTHSQAPMPTDPKDREMVEVLPIRDWQWLADQLRAWPERRVHPERTMCEGVLRPMAAAVIEDALSRLTTPTTGASAPGEVAWEFDADTREITCSGSPVFKVYEADDFPCIEDEDRPDAAQWYDDQASTAVLMLNSLLHANGDSTPILDPSPQDERAARLEEALRPFARLASPINGEEGRPTYLEAISGPNGTDELELRTYVGDGTRVEIMDAADFRKARAALSSDQGGEKGHG